MYKYFVSVAVLLVSASMTHAGHDININGLSSETIEKIHNFHGNRVKRALGGAAAKLVCPSQGMSTSFVRARRLINPRNTMRAQCYANNVDKLITALNNNPIDFTSIVDHAGFDPYLPWSNFYCDAYDNVDCDNDTINELTQCSSTSVYRTMDGTCNNLNYRFWGAAETPFGRLQNHSPAYDDGVNSPRGFDTGDLPNPRKISLAMSNNPSLKIKSTTTLLFSAYGQFINHDITLTPFSTTINGSIVSEIDCCENGQYDSGTPHVDCWPLDVTGDPFFDGDHGFECRRFVRSLPVPASCKLGYREQVNLITHWLDASCVYGSSIEEEKAIRKFEKGALNFKENEGEEDDCTDFNSEYCLLPTYSSNTEMFAGDSRVLEAPGLTSLHTVFMRVHNKIASIIYANDKSLCDEFIFQETRRIVGALIQSITYNEMLPILLGGKKMKKMNLKLKDNKKYSTSYNYKIDPTIPNSFATVAFRYGHSLVGNQVAGINSFELGSNLFNFNTTNTFGQFPSNMMGGMSCKLSEAQDHILSEVLLNRLQANEPHFDVGSDLFALNVQRGRDHGTLSYIEMRKLCCLKEFKTYYDMSDDLRREAIRGLKQAYGSNPEDIKKIDLFAGGLAEKPKVKGAILGPTFSCIVGTTFKNMKEGDRFWFENQPGINPKPFTPDQLKSIRGTSLAEIFCHVTTVKELQNKVMLKPGLKGRNKKISCSIHRKRPSVLRDFKKIFCS